MLNGAEVKSLRAGRANLKDGYAKVEKGEVSLHNVHISPYSFAPSVYLKLKRVINTKPLVYYAGPII